MNQFPAGFLWGAATAAHQVEGNNFNSDVWVLEHVRPTLFVEPSLDACDHYHRYADDIRMLASLGLNTYRFSIEWARIEPERGHFSLQALDHYRRVLATCHEHGVSPVVTFYHFSSPRWFAAMGGWESHAAADLFVRYCERSAKHLGSFIDYACTFNEPNLPMQLRWIPRGRIPSFITLARMRRNAARAIGSSRFGCFFLGNAEKLQEVMIDAHRRGRDAIKSGPAGFPVGVAMSLQDEQAVGDGSKRDRKRAQVYDPWLAAAAESDFLGIQTYTRYRVGKRGDLPPEAGVELTQLGYEFWPEALEACIRYAATRVSVPIYITENGVATENDARRVEYIRRALAGTLRCIADGIDVRGYIHWSLLDNFEWIWGYGPTFGLVAVNRDTQQRTVRTSARFLGEIARSNQVPDLAAKS